MSELQIGLLAIGVAIIAGVFAYNKWQEARFRREARSQLGTPAEDVLMRPEAAAPARVEPTLAQDTDAAAEARTEQTGKRLPDAPLPGFLSEQLDAIVAVDLGSERPGQAIVECAPAGAGEPGRPVRLEGEAQAGWEIIDPGGRYRRIRLGMQLVDRRGAATREDLEAFAAAAGKSAAALEGSASSLDLPETLRLTAELDRFCGEVDIQIAVHVVGDGQAFAGTRVRALAESSGLVLDDDGRFVLRDDQGRALFSLANGEGATFRSDRMRELSTSTLILELDVPRAPDGPHTFGRFREFARHLADGLGARLVDDNQAVLGDAAFQAIAAQLAPVYAAMDSRGVPAGSLAALRLFS